jgi:DNA-binding transcriptional ArsR family regulator
MVESTIQLDAIFSSLSDATRRDILKRVSGRDLTISELAKPYRMSFAAVAKHISILHRAKLISKHRRGKEQIISAELPTVALAASYLTRHEKMWQERFDKLEKVLES